MSTSATLTTGSTCSSISTTSRSAACRSGRRKAPTQLDASGSLNKAPFQLSGELAPLAKSPHYAVTLDLKSLPLDSFATLLQDQVQRLSGQLSYEGTLAYQQDSDGYSIRQEGRTRVQALDTAVKQPPHQCAQQRSHDGQQTVVLHRGLPNRHCNCPRISS